jgi:hypothetical protein
VSEISAVLAVVLRDVTSTSPIDLLVEPMVANDLRGAEDGAWITIDGQSKVGVLVQTSDPLTQQIVEAADQIQDWLVEALAGEGFPSNWPPCGQHPDTHPLAAVADGDSAVWQCPTSGQTFSPIGGLRRG